MTLAAVQPTTSSTMVRWTKCRVVSGPTAPAAEADLAYTISLHREGGLPIEIPDQVTQLIMWPDFECEPIDPADPKRNTWPVLWIGQRFYPWIVHRPAAEECPPEGADSAMLEALNQIVDARMSRQEEAMPRMYSAEARDIDISLIGQSVELVHPGAATARFQVDSLDAVAYSTFVAQIQHKISPQSQSWVENDTGLRNTGADGVTQAPIDVRGFYATRWIVTDANATAKRVDVHAYADGGEA